MCVADPVTPALEASSLRQRGATRSIPPPPSPKCVTHPLQTTSQRAASFEPGAIKVRLTALRDFVAVLRSRYADSVFRMTFLLLSLQIGLLLWHDAHSPVMQRTEGLEARRRFDALVEELGRESVLDALALLRCRLAYLGPLVLVACVALYFRRSHSVYLLDFSLFQPPPEWNATHGEIITMLANAGEQEKSFDENDTAFMSKVLHNSGTGDATAWPPGILQCRERGVKQDQSMAAARAEAEAVIYGCLSELFQTTGVTPKEVDFLIINCSLFSPTPSLCALACNKFGMRSNVRTYNLSGQGCSASLLAVDLASELLQNNPGSIAVVVSTELITQSLYHGHQKGMLLQNTLFRCGGAALCLTNRARLILRAKYRLRHLVRTQTCDDEAFHAVYQCEDEHGHSGVRLSKNIVDVAGKAMKINLTQLGPFVLPLKEQLKVVLSLAAQRLGRTRCARYVPSFKSAIHFFCIHPGGRAVLDGIEKNLSLSPKDMEPSRATLRDRGNTSSSSIWYELRYIEEHMNIRRGHKVLQLAFGSGFKCNSAVWTRLR